MPSLKSCIMIAIQTHIQRRYTWDWDISVLLNTPGCQGDSDLDFNYATSQRMFSDELQSSF